MNLRNYESIEKRRRALEKKLNIKLSNIGFYPSNIKQAAVKNCENMIGVVQLPLGIAGPLKIFGQHVEGGFYVPLATTEGALVASVNRGCKAISLSGGARTFCESVGTTRGPVFKTRSLKDSFKFKDWLLKNFQKIKKAAQTTSSHLRLLEIHPQVVGNNVFVRFVYDTQDAMGMNMVTIATTKVTSMIQKKTGIKCSSISGNFCTDKKCAWLNFICGRGKKVWAQAVLKKEVVSKTLKTDMVTLHEVVYKKTLLGSALSGSLGFNGHYANIIAAIFAATGQDLAHVVEGSQGITTTEVLSDDKIIFSVYLPDLMIGTVGGGTNLGSFAEALEILGVFGGNQGKNSLKFAEIIAGAVLAGELSLFASLAEGSLARAHKRLGRDQK